MEHFLNLHRLKCQKMETESNIFVMDYTGFLDNDFIAMIYRQSRASCSDTGIWYWAWVLLKFLKAGHGNVKYLSAR